MKKSKIKTLLNLFLKSTRYLQLRSRNISCYNYKRGTTVIQTTDTNSLDLDGANQDLCTDKTSINNETSVGSADFIGEQQFSLHDQSAAPNVTLTENSARISATTDSREIIIQSLIPNIDCGKIFAVQEARIGESVTNEENVDVIIKIF